MTPEGGRLANFPRFRGASPACPVTRVIGHLFSPTPPGGFMVNKALKRRHGDTGPAGLFYRFCPTSADASRP
jgi:hypothetical protein